MEPFTILTVEDEYLLSENLGAMLRDEGYEVVAALNADEAIAALESRPDIRTIITDVDMPGSMDGLKLATIVRKRWPPVHIVITTGKGRPCSASMPTDSVYLPKPYQSEQIVSVVRRISA